MPRYLPPSAARRFYDRIGRLEDTQAFYEDPALDVLIREGGFDTARRVMEFGCGTGRLAERLLSGPLPDLARYAACDISAEMIDISRARLTRFGSRVTLWQSSGIIDFAPGHPPFDRIVTSYVLDLLPPGRIDRFIDAAHAALTPGGRLCVASITAGARWPASMITGAWRLLFRVSPLLVGGCRPIRPSRRLSADRWAIRHRSVRTAWGIPSEIVIAEPV